MNKRDIEALRQRAKLAALPHHAGPAQFSGRPGSYKSFVTVNLSCALAAGKDNWAAHRNPKQKESNA